ncbi:MAG: S41 family peptidase [Pseudomonadota bacterium]
MLLSVTASTASSLAVSDDATWFRSPAISPDGKTVLFDSHGDIWSVPIEGGTARALTRDEAWEGHPVWSRDGKHIAFASDRFGNLDVYVMSAEGTNLRRLTFHSTNDLPSDFSVDGSKILFSSARTDSAASSYFPTRALPELYEVPAAGGTPQMLMTNPAREARWSPDGDRIVYREEKAYENEWRQRDVNAFARDIWIYEVSTGAHTRITDNPAGDHAPRWSADGQAVFMQSEIDGRSFNVQRLDLESGELRALTSHTTHPARGLSVSDDETIVYSWHGELFRTRDGDSSEKIEVRLPGGRLANTAQPIPASQGIAEFDVSPDGKEIVFISRGEVFVTDAEFANTTRITDTPEQERSASFAPDGRSVIYAGEYEDGWAIFETKIVDQNEPRFSLATQLESRLVYRALDRDAFQPLYSPDGESIAFLEGRDAIRVIKKNGSQPVTVFSRELNYSYADGDLSFRWSPDSRYLVAEYAPRGNIFYRDIGIAPADGRGQPVDVSLSGYADLAPEWHSGGEVVTWMSDRFGERSHGSWGAEFDVVAAFLTEDAWMRFELSDQERALLAEETVPAAEEESEELTDADEESSDSDSESEEEPVYDIASLLNLPEATPEDEPLDLDLDSVRYRTVRLTQHSSDIAGAALSPDLSELYYLSRTEGGYDLWRRKLHEDENMRVAKLGASQVQMQLVEEANALVVLADGALLRSELGDVIELAPVQVGGEMMLRDSEERAYLFDHVWEQVDDKFYDPEFHGVDWDAMRESYQPKVAAVSNNRDFAELMSELLGQLNASHTGMRYRPGGGPDDDTTVALGAIFSTDAEPGLLISEVLPGGPLSASRLAVEPGERIVGVGGERLLVDTNPYSTLRRPVDGRLRLTIADQQGEERIVRVKPWTRGEEGEALYQRWMDRRRAIVEERSDGRIGYLHIRSMNDRGFREVFDVLFGENLDLEAVVIDTRFNGGGWLHDDLLTLFQGESYFNMRPRGRVQRGAPEERWTKPSIVVMNEGNYSNAHMFPFAYKLFDVGKLVGMPVPGTATAVWWERLMSGDLIFGIPQLPLLDQQNRPLENQELQPDMLVDNPPADAARGIDRPLEAAVDELLEQLGSSDT